MPAIFSKIVFHWYGHQQPTGRLFRTTHIHLRHIVHANEHDKRQRGDTDGHRRVSSITKHTQKGQFYTSGLSHFQHLLRIGDQYRQID